MEALEKYKIMRAQIEHALIYLNRALALDQHSTLGETIRAVTSLEKQLEWIDRMIQAIENYEGLTKNEAH